MKHKKSYIGIVVLAVLLVILQNNIFIKESTSTSHYPIAYDFQGIIEPNDPTSINFFLLGSEVDILSDVQVSLTVLFNPLVFSRQISLIVNNSGPVDITIECFLDLNDFIGGFLEELPNQPNLEDILLLFTYNCYFRITSNSTLDQMIMYFDQEMDLGLDPEKHYTLATFKQGDSEWSVIPTEEIIDETTSKKIFKKHHD